MAFAPSELSTSDAATLRSVLEAAAPGDTISYGAMSKAIGRDVLQHRGALYKALKQCMTDRRMVFSVVRDVGYKRLDDAEIVATGADGIKRLRRAGRRSAQKLACVQFDALAPELRTAHNARMTVFALVGEVTDSTSIKRVERAVSDANSALPAARAAVAALGASIS